jgi:flagellar hook-associated protein 3 FlgL
MMRVTSQSLSTQVIDSLQQAYQRMAKAQEVITSGRRINRFSDDPIGATRVVGLRTVEASLAQYENNIKNSRPFLEGADSSLSGVTEALQRAKEIALGMANDTNTPADRLSAAAEVEQIFQQVLSQSNTKVQNQSIFAGYLNGAPAFAEGANGVTYQGDNGQILVQTSATSSLAANLPGSRVFQGADVIGGVGIFDVLKDLQTTLEGSSAARSLSLAINLDSSLAAGTGFSPVDAVGTEAPLATFTGEADFSTVVTVFDSLGQGHNLTFLFAKTAATTLKYRVVADADEIVGGTPGNSYQVAPEGTLEFNPDGTLNAGASTLTNITVAGLKDGAADISIAGTDLNFAGSTQLADPSAVLSLAQTNLSGIQAQIGRLDGALDQVSRSRAEIGARLNSAQAAADAVTILQDHTVAQRSSIEDADVLSAYSDFARLQQAFEAALQSAAQLITPSLLDFLR